MDATSEPELNTPYPPGYSRAEGRLPEQVKANLPADITAEQVLIADDGCYFYHRGATTYAVKGGNPVSRFCLEREPVGIPIDLNAPVGTTEAGS
ncbi:hypothetical protein AIOL_003349 [Candidatus Rhodobacter oscarellae]|uniref:Uncharacterized protein n=1 Tax=Candidatus Rhodobacter oscarellae TaxID=1675527 RepID=A0A0J9E6T0_9RHOB|nr:hypothetical protein AIOL_003349 [Candidatus Rhodobacter lobularis]